MTITLSPEHEALVDAKVRSGQFASREAVVAHALETMQPNFIPAGNAHLTPGERAKELQELWDEIDADPAFDGPPLPDEAFDRDVIYDNERTRI